MFKIDIEKSTLPDSTFRMAVVGSTKSGKTNVIKNLFLRKELLKKNFRDDDVFVFSKTLHVNDDYDDFKTANKFDTFDQGMIKEIIQDQKDLIKSVKKHRTPHIVIILDDFAADPRFWSSPVLNDLCVSGRHIKISIVMIVQRWKAIPRTCRLNLNLLLWFRSSNQSEIDQVADEVVLKKYRKDFVNRVESVFDIPFSFLVFHLHNKTNNKITVGFTYNILDFKV